MIIWIWVAEKLPYCPLTRLEWTFDEGDIEVQSMTANETMFWAAVVLQNTNLVQSQEKWQVWFDELEQNLKSEGRRRFGFSDELIAVRQVCSCLAKVFQYTESVSFWCCNVPGFVLRTAHLIRKAQGQIGCGASYICSHRLISLGTDLLSSACMEGSSFRTHTMTPAARWHQSSLVSRLAWHMNNSSLRALNARICLSSMKQPGIKSKMSHLFSKSQSCRKALKMFITYCGYSKRIFKCAMQV